MKSDLFESGDELSADLPAEQEVELDEFASKIRAALSPDVALGLVHEAECERARLRALADTIRASAEGTDVDGLPGPSEGGPGKEGPIGNGPEALDEASSGDEM